MYRTVNNMSIEYNHSMGMRGSSLDLSAPVEERYYIGRARTGYGIIWNEAGIACFIE